MGKKCTKSSHFLYNNSVRSARKCKKNKNPRSSRVRRGFKGIEEALEMEGSKLQWIGSQKYSESESSKDFCEDWKYLSFIKETQGG